MANSGKMIFLLLTWVGCCSWDTHFALALVPMAGGAACLAAAAFLDLVLCAGAEDRGGGPARAVLRFFLLRIFAIFWMNSAIGAGGVDLLASCAIDLVVRRSSLSSLSTLGTGCTLGSVCGFPEVESVSSVLCGSRFILSCVVSTSCFNPSIYIKLKLVTLRWHKTSDSLNY